MKSNEFIIPSRSLRLNKYKNIPTDTMNKIKYDIGANFDTANNTAMSKRTLRFVVAKVGSTRDIWSIRANRWKPIFIFIKKTQV